jgi:pyruvate dehydrogenase kinase 2/3/4
LNSKEDSNTPLPGDIQCFLDGFYMSSKRMILKVGIGIRMLLGQHIAINMAMQNPNSTPENHVGIICTKTILNDVVQDAILNAKSICTDYYGMFEAPEIKLIAQTNLEFMYVNSHLHHILFELLKNSLRAVTFIDF